MVTGALIGAGCIGLLGAGYFLPQVHRYTNARALLRAAVQTRSLVLTYDDGPGAASTPLLLSALKQHQARATFFLLGRQAQAHPELVTRLLEEGHEIGCHTYAHQHAWRVAPWRAVRDIQLGYRALAPWLPANGSFRPPYGKLTLATWMSLLRRHAAAAMWTADSGDTFAELPPPAAVLEQVRSAGGGVVLMHDFDRDPRRIDFVLEVTGALVGLARREGLAVKTLRELPLGQRN